MAKNKGTVSESYRKEMEKYLDRVDKIIYKVAANTISEMMLQTADDYEFIYQKCVTKFYSTYKTKKYIRHGNIAAGIKRGNNLYRASISAKEWGVWHENEVLLSVDTDRTLYVEEDSTYDTSGMLSYKSLSKKIVEPVDPFIIVSNMMNGIRYPSLPGRLVEKTWNTGKLTVKTSIGSISNPGTPIDLIDTYDKIWSKTFINRFNTLFNDNISKLL